MNHVIVIGDVMLDKFVHGEADRISPEAPVPVVHVLRRTCALGGAANVARNLICLGCKAWLFGVRGDDRAGNRLATLLDDHKIVDMVLVDKEFQTISKTRVVANRQQVVRFDDERRFESKNGSHDRIISDIEWVLNNEDIKAIVISDYDKGLISTTLATKVIALGNILGIPILVDPKRPSWNRYWAATVLKPNVYELSKVARVDIRDYGQTLEFAKMYLKRLNLMAMLVTMGREGMVLVREEGVVKLEAEAREVFDVCGAGDTVIATLAAMMARGHDLDRAMAVANKAAGIVVGKPGTQPITKDELEDYL